MSPRRALFATLVAALSLAGGCRMADSDFQDTYDPYADMDVYGSDTGSTDAAEAVQFARIDVFPPDDLVAPTGEGYLPQTFTATPRGVSSDVLLAPSVHIDGVVAAYATAPYRDADLPGLGGPVGDALVSVRRAASVQSANDVTGADPTDDSEFGAFHLTLPPGADYVVSVIPSTPELPFLSSPLAVTEDLALPIDLGAGAAVYGTVTDANGDPVAGVAVRAVANDGLMGPPALTDANGDYLLRVQPGLWTIRSEGRSTGRDPVLVSSVTVPVEGAAVDFAYGSLELVSVGGRVVDDHGVGLTSARVHLYSLALDGYEDGSFDAEVLTNRDGNFDTRVLRGTYRVEVVPDRDAQLSAASFEAVVVDSAFEDLGETVLPSFAQVVGAVADADGNSVPGAVITLREVGFDERSWTATADASGAFSLMGPRTAVEAWIAPPADRPDLANTRLPFEPSSETAPLFVVDPGVRFSGTVTAPDIDGEVHPVPFAIVEIVDDRGVRWGGALTDSQGAYTVRVDWPVP